MFELAKLFFLLENDTTIYFANKNELPQAIKRLSERQQYPHNSHWYLPQEMSASSFSGGKQNYPKWI